MRYNDYLAYLLDRLKHIVNCTSNTVTQNMIQGMYVDLILSESRIHPL